MSDVLEALQGILFELAIKGPGYILVKLFRPKADTDPDGCLVVVLGIGFWLVLALLTWALVVVIRSW